MDIPSKPAIFPFKRKAGKTILFTWRRNFINTFFIPQTIYGKEKFYPQIPTNGGTKGQVMRITRILIHQHRRNLGDLGVLGGSMMKNILTAMTSFDGLRTWLRTPR